MRLRSLLPPARSAGTKNVRFASRAKRWSAGSATLPRSSPDDLVAGTSELPWAEIKGMRIVVDHAYHGIDYERRVTNPQGRRAWFHVSPPSRALVS